MNRTQSPILSLKVRRLMPIRHRFACREESFSFYGAHRQKVRDISTKSRMPSCVPRLWPARTAILARMQKLKSP